MDIFGWVSKIIKPAADIIDDLHTSEEEKLTAKGHILALQNALTEKLLAYETALMELRTRVITAEANGQSFLQRNWRPITMLTFLVLIVADTFGWTTFRLAPDAWELLKMGIGGYVLGRSGEKMLPGIVEALKHRKDK